MTCEHWIKFCALLKTVGKTPFEFYLNIIDCRQPEDIRQIRRPTGISQPESPFSTIRSRIFRLRLCSIGYLTAFALSDKRHALSRTHFIGSKRNTGPILSP